MVHQNALQRNTTNIPTNRVGRGTPTPTLSPQWHIQIVGVRATIGSAYGAPRPTGFPLHKNTGAGTSVPPNATEVASPIIKALSITQYTHTPIHQYTVYNCTPYYSPFTIHHSRHTHIMPNRENHTAQNRSICIPTRERGNEGKGTGTSVPQNGTKVPAPTIKALPYNAYHHSSLLTPHSSLHTKPKKGFV